MYDAFGAKGPENALIPERPPQAAESPKADDRALAKRDFDILERQLGFLGDRSRLREESDEEFKFAAGSLEGKMDVQLFVETASHNWMLNRRAARACFVAGDLDRTNRINRQEYLLLREAFWHDTLEGRLSVEKGAEEHEAIQSLRLRAVLHFYDANGDGKLSRAEILAWLTDLCASPRHVERIARALTEHASGEVEISESTQLERMTRALTQGDEENDDGSDPSGLLGRMVSVESLARSLCDGDNSVLERRLREHDLSTRDMARSFRLSQLNTNTSYRRVVYDGRAETAKQWVARSGRNSYANSLKDGVTTAGIPGNAVNELLKLHPDLRAVGGWRGPLALQRSCKEFHLATRIIEVATSWAADVCTQADRPCDAWLMGRGGTEALIALLGETKEKAQAQAIASLAAKVKRVFAAQPGLVHAPAPCKVFGDVHGQLRDLMLLFGWYGMPTHKGGDVQAISYVFNGDWVDRGPHQLECVLVLFALKARATARSRPRPNPRPAAALPCSRERPASMLQAMYPSRIFLVRGNHEFRDMNEAMGPDGFLHHCKERLPTCWTAAYDAIHEAFEWLPLGAVVERRILVVHGGIGDGSWGLRELRSVQRPLSDDHYDAVTLQALWSDPSDSDSVMRSGVHSSERGEDIPEFGADVTEAFCEANELSVVVRSHQFVRQGYKVMHGGRLVTLFSARNYFTTHDDVSNDGALLLVAPDGNGHLRLHPKRLAHLVVTSASTFAAGGWRSRFVRCIANCLDVPASHRHSTYSHLS